MRNFVIKVTNDSCVYYFTSFRYRDSKRLMPAHCMDRGVGIIQGEKNKEKVLNKLTHLYGSPNTTIEAITLEEYQNE